MDAGSTSPASILRNLFAQLLPVTGNLMKDFNDIFLRKDKPELPPSGLPYLCDLIRRVSKYYLRVIVAVDALDECNENREDLARTLRELGQVSGFSVFLTSRKEYDIDVIFQGLPSISLKDSRIQIEIDMEAYISDELQKRRRLARLRDSLKAKVAVTLIEEADGM